MEVFALFLLALSYASAKPYICSIEEGGNLLLNAEGQRAKIDFPCKFPMVDQTCGDYHVVITPGLVDADHRFFVNTIWIELTHTKSGKQWMGRTSNKIAMQYIDDTKNLRFPVVPKIKESASDVFSTAYLFDFDRTGSTVTMREKKEGAFTIKFSPYTQNKKHKSVELEYRCDAAEVYFPPYPEQFCGGFNETEVRDRAREVGIIGSNKPIQSDDRLMINYYEVFTDLKTDQTPSPQCREAAKVMTQQCPNKEKQLEALKVCGTILSSENHRQCAAGFSCTVIEVFVDCLKFVCSDYKDKDACERVGDAIDFCRDFPGLTEKVKECYTGIIDTTQ